MEAKHVINMAATVCPPEHDQLFNKWYDEKHIPVNMKFKGLIGVTRYRMVKSSDNVALKEHPQYFTTYEFKDLATFQEWNASPELAEASDDIDEINIKLGVDIVWRVQYECMRTWKNTPPLSVINILGTKCPPETEADFNEWYSNKHIPDLLKFKDMEGVARYKLASSSHLAVKLPADLDIKTTEYPGFLTIYYFKDRATCDAYDASQERTATLDEAAELKKKIGYSVQWRAQYEPMRTWQR